MQSKGAVEILNSNDLIYISNPLFNLILALKGGPLFDKEKGTLVGVVSWGFGCADARYPGVYARVSKKYIWMKSIICKNDTDKPFCSNDPPAPSPDTSSPPSLPPVFEIETESPSSPPSLPPVFELETESPSSELYSMAPSTGPTSTGSPSPTVECEDSPLKFQVKFRSGRKKFKNCEWVAEKKDQRCNMDGGRILDVCAKTCDFCGFEYCFDFPRKFKLEGEKRSCKYAKEKKCENKEGLAETCRVSCGLCKSFFY